jgi:hypothetical protein
MGGHCSKDDDNILEGYMDVSKNKKWLIVTPLMSANSPSDVILVAIHSIGSISIEYMPKVECFTLFIGRTSSTKADMRSVLLGREAANSIVQAITGDVIKMRGIDL